MTLTIDGVTKTVTSAEQFLNFFVINVDEQIQNISNYSDECTIVFDGETYKTSMLKSAENNGLLRIKWELKDEAETALEEAQATNATLTASLNASLAKLQAIQAALADLGESPTLANLRTFLNAVKAVFE